MNLAAMEANRERMINLSTGTIGARAVWPAASMTVLISAGGLGKRVGFGALCGAMELLIGADYFSNKQIVTKTEGAGGKFFLTTESAEQVDYENNK